MALHFKKRESDIFDLNGLPLLKTRSIDELHGHWHTYSSENRIIITIVQLLHVTRMTRSQKMDGILTMSTALTITITSTSTWGANTSNVNASTSTSTSTSTKYNIAFVRYYFQFSISVQSLLFLCQIWHSLTVRACLMRSLRRLEKEGCSLPYPEAIAQRIRLDDRNDAKDVPFPCELFGDVPFLSYWSQNLVKLPKSIPKICSWKSDTLTEKVRNTATKRFFKIS